MIPTKNKHMQSQNDTMLTEENDILQRWREYFLANYIIMTPRTQYTFDKRDEGNNEELLPPDRSDQ